MTTGGAVSQVPDGAREGAVEALREFWYGKETQMAHHATKPISKAAQRYLMHRMLDALSAAGYAVVKAERIQLGIDGPRGIAELGMDAHPDWHKVATYQRVIGPWVPVSGEEQR